jgi:hypothetical protein
MSTTKKPTKTKRKQNTKKKAQKEQTKLSTEIQPETKLSTEIKPETEQSNGPSNGASNGPSTEQSNGPSNGPSTEQSNGPSNGPLTEPSIQTLMKQPNDINDDLLNNTIFSNLTDTYKKINENIRSNKPPNKEEFLLLIGFLFDIDETLKNKVKDEVIANNINKTDLNDYQTNNLNMLSTTLNIVPLYITLYNSFINRYNKYKQDFINIDGIIKYMVSNEGKQLENINEPK